MPLEGNYTTWTKKWEYNFTDGLKEWYQLWGVFQADYLYCVYTDSSSYRRLVVVNLADGTNKFLSTAGQYYVQNLYYNDISYPMYNTITAIASGALVFSVMGKYVVVGRYDLASTKVPTFEVWKNGELLWTSPVVSDAVAGATSYTMIGIRYDGKYIIAVTDTKVLVCFEGS